MKQETLDYINSLAECVINTYHISIPLTDIHSVVKTLGGEIVEFHALNDVYDGLVKKNSNTSFSIAVNKHQDYANQKFDIACRLGHLFMHMGFHTNEELWNEQNKKAFRQFQRPEQQEQAIEFAFALLMPKTMFIEAVNTHTMDGVVNIEEVARIFDVSKYTALRRGLELGVIQYNN